MLSTQTLERRWLQLWLLVGDALGLLVAYALALQVRFPQGDLWAQLQSLFIDGRYFTLYFIFVFSNYVFDLYEPRHWRSSLFSPLKIIFATVASSFLIFAWLYFFASEASGIFGRGVLLGAISIYVLFSLALRRWVNSHLFKRTENLEWLLIGSEGTQMTLLKDWQRFHLGGRLVWLDIHKMSDDKSDLIEMLQKRWAGLIVDNRITSNSDQELTRIFMDARLRGRIVMSLLNFYEFYCGKVPVRNLNDAWFAFTDGFSIIHSQISMRLKRFTDILISTILLVFLSPLMLLLAIFIRVESSGPALYSQVRVGQDGQLFTMWKFRSMRKDAEKGTGAQWAAKNDMRVTRLGRIMRKTRLDELPQLWNILKGDMSFIGPRPERPEFTNDLRKKIQFYDFRHLVKPGLTGWAQVMYPYGASVEDAVEKLQYDLFYIKNYSFARDIEILLKTISVVLFGAGR
jgi:exopolysaccharide biosynthesis polyprenyl glycosylphosphotransferase